MSHRSIIKWNQWLNKSLGQRVLQSEQALLGSFLNNLYGKHAVLIGVPSQQDLLRIADIPCRLMLTPLLADKQEDFKITEISLHELPIASGCVDIVILSHTLELVDNPRQLLAEACRIVKPEGHVIIFGFNRYSLSGWKKLPFLHTLKQRVIRQWLHLLDFEMVKESMALYGPPILEWIGNKCHLPWGGVVYVLMAQAKVIPLTPIRLRWKQSLSSIRIPARIPGPTIRNSQ